MSQSPSKRTLFCVELVLENVDTPVWDLLWKFTKKIEGFDLYLDQLYDLVADING